MTTPDPRPDRRRQGPGPVRRRRIGLDPVVLGLTAAVAGFGVLAACSGDEVTPSTEIPPAEDTMPVNSMVNNSAMVPGATLEPVAPGGPEPPAPGGTEPAP